MSGTQVDVPWKESKIINKVEEIFFSQSIVIITLKKFCVFLTVSFCISVQWQLKKKFKSKVKLSLKGSRNKKYFI